MKALRNCSVLIFFLIISIGYLHSEIPGVINYQAKLVDENGNALSDGVYSLTFTIFDAPIIGHALWHENLDVHVKNGFINVYLGTNTAINIDFNKKLWLEVTIGKNKPFPRTPLSSVPYALNAKNSQIAQTVVDGAITTQKLAPGDDGDVLMTSGSNVVWAPLTNSTSWSLSGNSGTVVGKNFIGTTDNVPFEMRVANKGTKENQLFIGANNEIYRENPNIARWVVGTARGQAAVDLQGYRKDGTHVASGSYSTVAGGGGNTASGNWSTVGGGYKNIASSSHSTVGGGYFNTARSGDFSTVGGGRSNTASGIESTVSGGQQNTASSNYSTVGGGVSNTASGTFSTVEGGYYAKADKYGQNAYASGRFANQGDAQTSVFVVRNVSNNGLFTYLYLDGTSATQSITLNDHDRWAFRALVVGSSDDGSHHAAFEITGYIQRDGTVVKIYGVKITAIHVTDHRYLAEAVVSGTALKIRVVGEPSTIMHWVARVEVAQLNF